MAYTPNSSTMPLPQNQTQPPTESASKVDGPLVLTTRAKRPQVEIEYKQADGTYAVGLFEIKLADELDFADTILIGKVGVRMQGLAAGDVEQNILDLSDDDVKKLGADIAYCIDAINHDIPAEVLSQLSDMQKLELLNLFRKAPAA